MDTLAIFGIISAIVFIGFFLEIIFKKTNIPDVLLLILIGIGLGSAGFNLVDPTSFESGAALFSTFALVFILFQGALSIDFQTLFKSLTSTAKLTFITFFLTVLVVTGISYFLFGDFLVALLVGMILGGTSSAVVIPIVTNVEIKNKYESVLKLESAISDVLCIIGALTVLSIIETGVFEASSVFKEVITSFSLALVVGLFAGFIWIYILSKFELLSKSYMVTIAFVMGLYAFVESNYIGASGAIASLCFGLMLGNSRRIFQIMHSSNSNKYKSEEEDPDYKVIRNVLSGSAKTFYSEISFFVKTFFFVYLGLLIDFSNLSALGVGFLLTLGIFLIRPFAVKLSFLKTTLLNKERTILEVLVPKGLAAAVIAGLVVTSESLAEYSEGFVATILSVVFLSIVFTSILIFITEKDWFKGFIPYFWNKTEGKVKRK